MTPETLAFDKGSVRYTDKVGRLQVECSNISKANVCGYYGKEIPNSESLRLEPDKIYQLYRDPDELRKAAHTFNNIPVLFRHTPDYPKNPAREYRVGATHGNCEFKYPYLINGLSIWDDSAIAGIETEEQRELSPSYSYVADMTPGETPDGVKFDGVMRNLVGNHLCLVETGRSGPDVLVFDSKPLELKTMKLTKKSVAMRGALGSYLKPRLANDAAVSDLTSLVNSHKRPTAIALAAKDKFTTRLAADMEIEPGELAELLETAEATVTPEEISSDEDAEKQENTPAFDSDNPIESLLAILGDKVPEEVIEKIKAAFATAEDSEEKGTELTPETVSKPAMDAAIKAASVKATIEAGSRFKALRIAESEVRPLIGDVIAMDSAEDVYRTALEQSGINTSGVHPSAYQAMVQYAISQKQESRPKIAMDSASNNSFAADFPNAKLKRGY